MKIWHNWAIQYTIYEVSYLILTFTTESLLFMEEWGSILKILQHNLKIPQTRLDENWWEKTFPKKIVKIFDFS